MIENKKARQYTPTTIKRLFALSGNQCAFPDCDVIFVLPERQEIIAQICHIEAAELGGERYNPNQTDDERRDYNNLILLCPNHHVETDDIVKYSVEVLKEMKRNHELKILSQPSSFEKFRNNQTSLAFVINQLCQENLIEDTTTSFDINEKISYNNIVAYRPTIEYYKAFQGKLRMLYSEYEIQGLLNKQYLLQNIKSIYLKVKGKFVTHSLIEIEEIRKNADEIFEEVELELWKIIDKSTNLQIDIPFEAINISLKIIMVDAFMDCKILEEPPKK
ncbi:MAG TPA: hypothetical protein DCQ31_02705 [Bacteroidales bacterium]|nr:hypothetical protein [Bacteroidales bacterium]